MQLLEIHVIYPINPVSSVLVCITVMHAHIQIQKLLHHTAGVWAWITEWKTQPFVFYNLIRAVSLPVHVSDVSIDILVKMCSSLYFMSTLTNFVGKKRQDQIDVLTDHFDRQVNNEHALTVYCNHNYTPALQLITLITSPQHWLTPAARKRKAWICECIQNKLYSAIFHNFSPWLDDWCVWLVPHITCS